MCVWVFGVKSDFFFGLSALRVNGERIPPSQTTMASELVLASAVKYFAARPAERRALAALVQGQTDVSLRLLDWFVTHHAHSHSVLDWIDDATGAVHDAYPIAARDPARVRKFALYQDYRAQLRAFTKTTFDPFRRHGRVTFVVSDAPCLVTVETTTGQLNFFRWAFQNRVVEYVRAHLTELEDAMGAFMTERRAGRKQPAPQQQQHRAAHHQHHHHGSSGGGGGAPRGATALLAATPPARIAGNTFLRFD